MIFSHMCQTQINFKKCEMLIHEGFVDDDTVANFFNKLNEAKLGDT